MLLDTAAPHREVPARVHEERGGGGQHVEDWQAGLLCAPACARSTNDVTVSVGETGQRCNRSLGRPPMLDLLCTSTGGYRVRP